MASAQKTELDILVNYTNNYRFVKQSTIIADNFKITVQEGKILIKVPKFINELQDKNYRKNKTIWLLGQEIAQSIGIEVDWINNNNDIYQSEATIPVVTREFVGCPEFQGFFAIKDLTGDQTVQETTITIGESTESDWLDSDNNPIYTTFSGLIVLSIWTNYDDQDTATDPLIKKISGYINSAAFGDELQSESVKNYSYTKNTAMISKYGVPSFYLNAFNQWRKLPQSKFIQIKELFGRY